jgi:hypothetical protein
LRAHALEDLAARYARCATYRDRGTVLTRSSGGASYILVERFDTLFDRTRGLRFRYFADDGKLRFGIWALDGHVSKWFWDSSTSLDTRGTSALDALTDLKGVTKLVSWWLPGFLLGRKDRSMGSIKGRGSLDHYLAIEVRGVQAGVTEFAWDEQAQLLRRVYSVSEISAEDAQKFARDRRVVVIGGGPVPGLSQSTTTETWVLYEGPTCDEPPDAIDRELEKAPW